MSEMPKTLIFVGVAAVIGLMAFVFRPAPLEPPRQNIGDKLFSELEDATAASALEIVHYNHDAGEPVRLKVERDGDDWVIASHNDYPADASDAEERIRDVALKMIDLEILGVATELASDHALLGVVAPDGDQVKEANEEDVGVLVALEDDTGRTLAELVVGKQVQGDSEQRFVRKAREATVYSAKIDVDKLSSQFDDWIEDDLLDVNSFDIRRVTLKDYNFDVREVGRLPDGRVAYDLDYDPRIEVTVDWNNDDSKWELDELLEFRGGRLEPSELTEDEQLNKEKLDGLKNAIDDLKIVNVESKPQELISGVKSEKDLLNDPKIGPSLQEKGFYPVRLGGEPQLLSSNGEVRVQTEDGIEYILRFGRTAGVEEGSEEAKMNRYLLVSARVAEEQFAAEPEAMPPATIPPTSDPAEDDETPAEASGAAGDEGEAGEAGAPGDESDGSEQQDEANASPDDDAPSASPSGATNEEPQDEPADKPADDGGETPAGEDEPDDDDQPALNPPDTTDDDSGTADDDSGTADDDSGTADDDGEPADDASGEEEDETAKKRKEAEEKVAELNERFANWYYIISEDVYKKIHLGRFDIITEKEESSFGIDELRQLQDEGLERPEP